MKIENIRQVGNLFVKVIKSEGLPKEKVIITDQNGNNICDIFGKGRILISFEPDWKPATKLENIGIKSKEVS